MAHVQITSPHPEVGAPEIELRVDGIDFSDAVFVDGVEVVAVGDTPQTAECAVRLTIALSRLDINGEAIELTGNLEDAAARVAAIVADPERVPA